MRSAIKMWKIECTPYAKKVIGDMAKQLKEIRKSMPPMTDQEWKKWVMDRIEWKEISKKE